MTTSSDHLIIRQPDDWHVHLRDGDMLKSVANYTARQFARAIIMPNLAEPITTIAAGRAYRARILSAITPQHNFTPLMTCYLTDSIDPLEIETGFKDGLFTACKLYPANATTNSSHGVTDIKNISKVLGMMEKNAIPLLIHGEVTDPHIDIFDREAIFIETILSKIIKDFPELKIVFEHITTSDAVAFVEGANPTIGATITPHHLEFNRNAIFKSGIRPDYYCLPIAKREQHRLALRRAATSGSDRFFLGTDSAPHQTENKYTACGCAGIFNAPHAIESYAKVFDEENALDTLEAFASENGPRFYGLPLNKKRIVLERKTQTAPNSIPTPAGDITPFHSGNTLNWSFGGLVD